MSLNLVESAMTLLGIKSKEPKKPEEPVLTVEQENLLYVETNLTQAIEAAGFPIVRMTEDEIVAERNTQRTANFAKNAG